MCEYVGEIKGFSTAKTVVIPIEIYESHPNFARPPDVVVCYPSTNPPKYV
jgi:hypothetical protein